MICKLTSLDYCQIPGVTLPLSHAWYLLLSFLLGQIVHEPGHAIAGALWVVALVLDTPPDVTNQDFATFAGPPSHRSSPRSIYRPSCPRPRSRSRPPPCETFLRESALGSPLLGAGTMSSSQLWCGSYLRECRWDRSGSSANMGGVS
jgi:hypothetical protein